MEAIAGIDPLDEMMGDAFADLVDAIAAADHTIAAITAVRAELVDQARQWSEIHNAASAAASSSTNGWTPERVARRELVTELACALRMPERAAENLIEQSRSLAHELPATMESLRRGQISLRHAQVIIDNADSLPEESRAQFEAAVIGFARNLTIARFAAKARVVRERMHPDSIDARVAARAEDRELALEPARDGMAWLHAYLPAVDAQAIYHRMTDIALRVRDAQSADAKSPASAKSPAIANNPASAKSPTSANNPASGKDADGARVPSEVRTLSQLRVDAFRDLLVHGTTDDATGGLCRGIVARVLVTVPALTLLGRTLDGRTLDGRTLDGQPAEPAILEGYGPIDADTARELAAGAPSFTRLLTHPETGAVLSVGRDRYSVPKDLRSWLRVRDGTCRFVGCAQSARRCDIDHTDDWQFGNDTAHDNLAHLCPKHHQLKHHTGWRVEQVGGGVLEWTSPLGRTFRTEPETQIDPAGISAA